MRLVYHVMSAPPPLGLLFLAASARGLRYVEFMDRRSLKRTIAAHAAAEPGATWEPSVRELRPLAEHLEQYLCGAETGLRLPLDPVGTEFERHVWQALLEIPYGETRSYGDIAKAIGQPKGARAVGLAANQNPIAIVIPCHRVIGADGKLVGYSGGLPRKKFLLALEARFQRMEPIEGDRVIAAAKVQVAAAPRTASAPKPAAKRPAARAAVVAVKPVKSAKRVAAAVTRRPARSS